MKLHYGITYNAGDYELPLICCDETLCGYTGEIPTENTTEYWNDVDCKKCLKLRNAYEAGMKEDEKAIVNQMGDMAEFFEQEKKENEE